MEGFKGVHGDKGFGERNEEGLKLLEFAQAADLCIINTKFEKPELDRVTYKSGENATQVDYMLTTQLEWKNVRNVQVVKNEECVKQHRLLIMDWRERPVVKRPPAKIKRIKTWRLKEEQVRKDYIAQTEKAASTRTRNVDIETNWQLFKKVVRGAALTVCGQTKGVGQKRKLQVWSETIKDLIKQKRKSFLTWQKSQNKEDRLQYIRVRNQVKQTIQETMQNHAKQVAQKLQNSDSQTIYRYIRNQAAQRVDIGQMRQLKDPNGKILTKEEEILKTWTAHMTKALNVETTKSIVLEPVICTEGPELPITVEEVKVAMVDMKTGKAAGKSEVSTEMLKPLGEKAVAWLTEIFNRIWREGRLPEDWRTGIIIPIYKGKGDPLDCNSYRPIKLLEHAMKVMERVIDRRLRNVVTINEMQRGFMPGRTTMDAIFAIRTIVEKHLEKNKDVWAAFVDLEKAYDRVPRELIWWALRRQGVNEYLVKAVQTLYHEPISVVRITTRKGIEIGPQFKVNTGVHQGSALSPLLFILVMQEVSQHVARGTPWELLFADDLAITTGNREQLVQALGQWKEALESAGLKVNVAKTKVIKFDRETESRTEVGRYPCAVCGKGVGANSLQCQRCKKWVHARCSKVNGKLNHAAQAFVCSRCLTPQQTGERNVRIGEEEFEKVDEFCYLGHTLEASGRMGAAVRARIKKAWINWKSVAQTLTQKELDKKVRGKIYTATIRSTMLYSAESWALRKEELDMLERTQSRMVRWMAGVRKTAQIPGEALRKAFGLEPISDAIRRARLRWFGHIARRGPDHLTKLSQTVEVEGQRQRGRPLLTWTNCIDKDISLLKINREDAADRVRWRNAIC